uniref:hypothetical protein n=1 Tax=Cupriavidus taiwanensis TaxID=164546 RepID=UPI003F491972
MDLRDIQRLHEQYAQGPITIDVDAAPVAALNAPTKSAQPPQPTTKSNLLAALDGNKRLIVMMLLVAAISLPVGMMLASATKRSPATAPATTPETVATQPTAAVAPAESTQWTVTKEPPGTEADVAKPSGASAPSPTVASAVQAPRKVQPSKLAPAEARKPDPAAHSLTRVVPKDASASAEVKLF